MNTHVDKSLSLSRDICPKTLEEKEKMSKVPYISVIGSLIYAMMCTCPDICYVVGLISRYQSNPGQKHWMAVKMILRYLKGTSNYMICYLEEKKRTYNWLVTLMLIREEMWTSPNQLRGMLSCLMIVQYYEGARNNHA